MMGHLKLENNKDKTKYLHKINQVVGRNIYQHQLIEENDKVLIGLSGGKDSLVLLETLANRKKHLPYNFEMIAAHINIENISYEIDSKYLKELCDYYKIQIIFRNIQIDLEKDPNKGICFICSWQRRKELFALTRELNCNKLALGHHLDDSNQTFLMNLIYHSSISAIPYKLKMFHGRVYLIRPLLNIRENKIKEYADIREYPSEKKLCPFGDKTKRSEVKEILKSIEKIHPKSHINIFEAHHKIFNEYLPEKKLKRKAL